MARLRAARRSAVSGMGCTGGLRCRGFSRHEVVSSMHFIAWRLPLGPALHDPAAYGGLHRRKSLYVVSADSRTVRVARKARSWTVPCPVPSGRATPLFTVPA